MNTALRVLIKPIKEIALSAINYISKLSMHISSLSVNVQTVTLLVIDITEVKFMIHAVKVERL